MSAALPPHLGSPRPIRASGCAAQAVGGWGVGAAAVSREGMQDNLMPHQSDTHVRARVGFATENRSAGPRIALRLLRTVRTPRQLGRETGMGRVTTGRSCGSRCEREGLCVC